MIIDSSVFIAILKREFGYEKYLDRAVSSAVVYVPSCVFVETSLVILGQTIDHGLRLFEDLMVIMGAEIMPFTASHARSAQHAAIKYGKGQGHPAQLNFGDCMVYAVAKAENMPLLYVGDDFEKTDIESALD